MTLRSCRPFLYKYTINVFTFRTFSWI